MRLNDLALLSVLLLAPVGCLAQAKVEGTVSVPPVLERGERLLKPMAVVVKVSAAGAVTEVRPAPEVPAEIAALLTKSIAAWTFEPARKDGRPVDWAAQLSVGLRAMPRGDTFALRIDSVQQTNVSIDSESRARNPPQFPVDALRARKSAVVVVELMPAADGAPAQAIAVWLDGHPSTRKNDFVRTSLDAVIKWRITPLALDGVPYPETTCVPIFFDVSERSATRSGADYDGAKLPCLEHQRQSGTTGPSLKTAPVGQYL